MTINITSPITGAAQTGFTSPTYTLTSDVAPSVNAKQYAVTAVGGTQTGVATHSVSKPFTLTFFRPSVLKTLPQANNVTGIISKIGKNTYKLITRKGAEPAASQIPLTAMVTTTIEVPAGTDTYEPEEIKAMLSAHFGALHANASSIGDTVLSGIM